MADGAAFSFEMSVIIPVYNAEPFLENCIASLDAQSMSQNLFEVVLVNDGSTDKSLDICKEVVASRSNYALVSQENQGVSAARNAGISAAQGRYLMFLDSDDTISQETIENLVNAFDRFGSEVDLVTYAIEYVDGETGETHGHKRQQWLTQTGVYDLVENPFIAQSTMNVCVRNTPDAVRFSEKLKMGEDQYYITTWLSRKAVIGYCNEAKYRYVKHGKSASASGDYPQYAFEDMMTLFEELLSMANRDSRMRCYAYALILYNMGWRYRQQKLFPDYGDDDERAENGRRLSSIARRIPCEDWASTPYMNDEHKLRLCVLFGIVSENPNVVCVGDKRVVCCTDGYELVFERPVIRLSQVQRVNDDLLIDGRITGPTLLIERGPELKVLMKDGPIAVPLTLHDGDCADIKIANLRSMAFSIRLFGICSAPNSVSFFVSFAGREREPLEVRFDGDCCPQGFISWKIRSLEGCPLSLANNTLFVRSIRGFPKWVMPAVRMVLALRKLKG